MNTTDTTDGIEVILERDPGDRTKPTRAVDRWNAWLGDELIVEGARDPEHDACRALLEMGVVGRVWFRHRGSPHTSMVMDIATAAGLTVRESADKTPHLAPYKPFPVPTYPPKNGTKGLTGTNLPRRTNGLLRNEIAEVGHDRL